MCGLDVAVTMVDADDHGLGAGKIHFRFLLSVICAAIKYKPPGT
jgi:hypothetical protein